MGTIGKSETWAGKRCSLKAADSWDGDIEVIIFIVGFHRPGKGVISVGQNCSRSTSCGITYCRSALHKLSVSVRQPNPDSYKDT